MKRFGYGMLAGIGLALAVLTALPGHQPQPGTRVTEQPGPEARREASIVIGHQGTGVLNGTVIVPVSTPASPGNQDIGPLHPGDRVGVPVSGTLHTFYFDAATGARLGEGTHSVTGVTTVQAETDRLTVETVFEDRADLAVQLPVTTWRLNLGTGGVDLQREQRLYRNLYWQVGVGRAFGPDRSWRVTAGISYKF